MSVFDLLDRPGNDLREQIAGRVPGAVGAPTRRRRPTYRGWSGDQPWRSGPGSWRSGFVWSIH